VKDQASGGLSIEDIYDICHDRYLKGLGQPDRLSVCQFVYKQLRQLVLISEQNQQAPDQIDLISYRESGAEEGAEGREEEMQEGKLVSGLEHVFDCHSNEIERTASYKEQRFSELGDDKQFYVMNPFGENHLRAAQAPFSIEEMRYQLFLKEEPPMVRLVPLEESKASEHGEDSQGQLSRRKKLPIGHGLLSPTSN